MSMQFTWIKIFEINKMEKHFSSHINHKVLILRRL
jgi:hypothetical protein